MSLQGDYLNALPYYEEALITLRDTGHALNAARIVCRLGYLALRQEEIDRAMTLFAESLELFHEKGELRGIAACLAGYGEMNRVLGRAVQAVRLLGYVEAFLQSSGGVLINPVERIEYERSIRAIRESPLIDEAKFNLAWEEGKKMTMEQAIELVRLDTSAWIESNVL